MKRFALYFFFVLLLSALLITKNQRKPATTSQSPEPEITNSLDCELCQFKDFVQDDQNFKAVWLTVNNPLDLFLIANFQQKKNATDLYKENNCAFLINGGFYSPQNLPIGLFFTNQKTLSVFQTNRLFNGIFSVGVNGEPKIATAVPEGEVLFALQTGPIIMRHKISQKLAIANDKNARRMVVALSDQNEIIFLAFYDPASSFSGPTLAKLPEALSFINESENLNLTDAVNLDGGSASAFLLPDFKLTEASPIGSAFCLANR